MDSGQIISKNRILTHKLQQAAYKNSPLINSPGSQHALSQTHRKPDCCL